MPAGTWPVGSDGSCRRSYARIHLGAWAALPISPLLPTLAHYDPLCLGQNPFRAGIGELLLVGAAARQDHRPALRTECHRFVDRLSGGEAVREPGREAVTTAVGIRDRSG